MTDERGPTVWHVADVEQWDAMFPQLRAGDTVVLGKDMTGMAGLRALSRSVFGDEQALFPDAARGAARATEG